MISGKRYDAFMSDGDARVFFDMHHTVCENWLLDSVTITLPEGIKKPLQVSFVPRAPKQLPPGSVLRIPGTMGKDWEFIDLHKKSDWLAVARKYIPGLSSEIEEDADDGNGEGEAGTASGPGMS